MGFQLSNTRIIGVGLLLFFGVLLGVGMHHLIATGTCSSTGYSGDYGPVPTCPAGTGWWFAFLFGGIIGCLIGAGMAGSVGLVFAGIFGAIGLGALSLLLDSNASNSTKIFGGIFGGCFAVVGAVAAFAVIASALRSIRSAPPKRSAASASSSGTSAFGPTPAPSAFGTPQASSAFGESQASSAFGESPKETDPIMSAYQASHSAAGAPPVATSTDAVPRARGPVAGMSGPVAGTSGPSAPPTPLNLVSGLQAAMHAAAQDPVDELSKLAELHQKGALTDDEFARAKAKLLGQM